MDLQLEYFLKDLILASEGISPEIKERALDLWQTLLSGDEEQSGERQIGDIDVCGFVLTAKQFAEVQCLIGMDRKISAIKQFRSYTSAGLKDAKDAVESGAFYQPKDFNPASP